MKNNLIVCSCLLALLACGSATEKASDSEITEKENTITELPVSGVDTATASGAIEESVSPEAEPSEMQHQNEATPPVTTANVIQPESKSRVEPKAEPAAEVEKKSEPAPAQQEQAKTIIMGIIPDMMQFDKELITVKAGQKIILELENPDGMQHNLVIIKPGTLEKVGAAADALARDPKGAQQHYVPKMPEVLFATKLLNPEEVVTLTFTAPAQPGDYPFVCTFPGHWRMMKGIMRVVK